MHLEFATLVNLCEYLPMANTNTAQLAALKTDLAAATIAADTAVIAHELANSDDFLACLTGVEDLPEVAAEVAAQAAVDALQAAVDAEQAAADAAWELSHRCGKCNGKGKIVQFSHICGGDCFACGGTGTNNLG